MINVNQIAKTTLATLSARNMLLTPENYQSVFDEISAQYGKQSTVNEKIASYISRLPSQHASDAKGRKFKTLEEFVAFLLPRISSNKSRNQEQKTLISLLKLIALAPFKEAKTFSAECLDIVLNQDDALNKLQKLINENDTLFRQKSQELAALNQEANPQEIAKCEQICSNLAPALAFALSPSIAHEKSEKSKEFCEFLCQDPQLLRKNDVSKALEELTHIRIKNDKEQILSTNKALNSIITRMCDNISGVIGSTKMSKDKIDRLKSQINHLCSNAQLPPEIDKKLNYLTDAFLNELDVFYKKSNKEATAIANLQEKVRNLESEIGRLREESRKDFLTNIANKRQLEEQLLLTEETFKRYKINYAIVFFDIDNFKLINDTYGHAVGDMILNGIGEILRKNARKLDCPGRWGGEEFMVILPHSDTQGGYKFAEKIRNLVARHKFICKGEEIRVRISGGVSDRRSHEDADELLERVDVLLYAAKDAGKNNIKTAE